MLDKKLKQRIINKFRIHDNDTGSSQVQIAILTEEIKQLTDHLKMHKHDYSSRRGLLRKVGERRRLLKYLQREDEKAFLELAEKLKLKIAKKMIEDEEARKAEEAALFQDDTIEDEVEEVVVEKTEDDK
jgi:small subunit ribosomal protein S15